MNKPDTKAKAKRKRHKQNKKKPKAQNNASAADGEVQLTNQSAGADDDGEFVVIKFIELPVLSQVAADTPTYLPAPQVVWFISPGGGVLLDCNIPSQIVLDPARSPFIDY